MNQPRPIIKVAPCDYETLAANNPVNMMVINAYLRLVERRSVFHGSKVPQVWAFDTAFLTDWKKGQFQATEKRTRGVELFNQDLILFPIHVPHVGPIGHWALILVRPRRYSIEALDPAHLPRKKEMADILEFLRCYAQARDHPFCAEAWRITETGDKYPKQQDDTSCGIFVCAFSDMVARNADIIGRPIDPRTARKTIASVLRNGRFDQEEFPLSEPPDWRIGTRYAGTPARKSPVQVINLCSPDGQLSRYNGPEDPLLRELEEALSNLPSGRTEPLFPPLKKTPHRNATPMAGDGSLNVPMSSPTISGNESPYLELHDDEQSALDVESSGTPMGGSREDLAEVDPSLVPESPSSRMVPTLQEANPEPSGAVSVPPEILRRLREKSRSRLTSKQCRNQKWKIYREDGSFYRIRTRKLKRLLRQ